MRKTLLCLLALVVISTPAVSFAGIVELPDHVLQKKGFWAIHGDFVSQPKSVGDSYLPRLSVGYLWIDEGLMHLFQVGLGVNDRDQLATVQYGLGLGPRSGAVHAGLRLGVGYGHLWDSNTKDHMHSLVLNAGPFIATNLWLLPDLQILVTGGWSAIPVASQDIPDGRGWNGWHLGVGFAFIFE